MKDLSWTVPALVRLPASPTISHCYQIKTKHLGDIHQYGPRRISVASWATKKLLNVNPASGWAPLQVCTTCMRITTSTACLSPKNSQPCNSLETNSSSSAMPGGIKQFRKGHHCQETRHLDNLSVRCQVLGNNMILQILYPQYSSRNMDPGTACCQKSAALWTLQTPRGGIW